MKTSIMLTEEATQAKKWLEDNEEAGFNFSTWVSRMLVKRAKELGWIGCLLVMFIAGCGSDGVTQTTPTIIEQPSTPQAQQIPTDPYKLNGKLLDKFNKTKECVLANYTGAIQEGLPKVVTEKESEFSCGGLIVWGCTDFNYIWIAEDRTTTFINTDSVFSEEVLHWLTGLNHTIPENPLFAKCVRPYSD